MTSSSTILSQTLQRLTDVKFQEIEKQLSSFTYFRDQTIKDVDDLATSHARLSKLLEALDGSKSKNLIERTDLADIRRLVDLSQHDPSVPKSLLDGFETQIRSALDGRLRSFEFARLYARLLSEWIKPEGKPLGKVDSGEHTEVVESHDDFEIVEKDRLDQLRRKFETVVFTAVDTSETEIDLFLSSLFEGEDGRAALNRHREGTRFWAERFADSPNPFTPATIRQSIRGLFKEDLLKDEKKTMLQEFEKNDTILNEIADVLNVRFADIQNWSWDAPNGLPVEPRRQLNGKYRIMADEDVLQAIFLHHVGLQWSVHFKTEWSQLAQADFWKEDFATSQQQKDRRKYFTGQMSGSGADDVASEARKQRAELLLAQLPDSVEASNANPYDEEEDTSEGKTTSPLKQRILRRLATDVLVRRTLHGEVAAVQADLHWYAPSLPHSTMLAVMCFYGVPEKWLKFFESFVKMPLNVAAGIDGTEGSVRWRERGMPIASMMNVFIGEMVLFGMDLAVNQQTGLFLMRLHDDFWFSGAPERVSDAWSTIQTFVKVMGLELNTGRCLSVYLSNGTRNTEILEKLPKGDITVGFLKLGGESGEWSIDQSAVSAHIKQLRKQLAACTSIFDWITTWNSCIGRFFNNNFGEPAGCFGRSHLESILQTHRHIQSALFQTDGQASSSVNEYLRQAIAGRFGVDAATIPDGFLFLPQSFGGLGLKNPFVPMFMIRDSLDFEPGQALERYEKDEREAYKATQKQYDALSIRERRARIVKIWGDNLEDSAGEAPSPTDPFMTYEEWATNPEVFSDWLGAIWTGMQELPYPRGLNGSMEDAEEFTLTDEERWVLEMHRPELKRMFAGPRIVDKHLLPLGVLEMMNSRKVAWQMVL